MANVYFNKDTLKHMGFRNIETGYDKSNREYSIKASKIEKIGKGIYEVSFISFCQPTNKLRLTLHNLIKSFIDDYAVFENLKDKEKLQFIQGKQETNE